METLSGAHANRHCEVVALNSSPQGDGNTSPNEKPPHATASHLTLPRKGMETLLGRRYLPRLLRVALNSSPQGDGNNYKENSGGMTSTVALNSSPQGDGNLSIDSEDFQTPYRRT